MVPSTERTAAFLRQGRHGFTQRTLQGGSMHLLRIFPARAASGFESSSRIQGRCRSSGTSAGTAHACTFPPEIFLWIGIQSHVGRPPHLKRGLCAPWAMSTLGGFTIGMYPSRITATGTCNKQIICRRLSLHLGIPFVRIDRTVLELAAWHCTAGGQLLPGCYPATGRLHEG